MGHKTDLHLISWNRPEMTELVIRTINRNTKPDTYRLIVLDNGSSSTEYLNKLFKDGLIHELHLFTENMGLENARQFALKKCTSSDRFVCIDNDCLPPPIKDGVDWLEGMNELLDQYEDFAAISMRTQVMIGTGNIFEEADIVGDDIVQFPHPGGSYRIMRTDVVNFVGGWDRDNPGRGAEERYICGKLNDAGFKTAFTVKLRTLHLFGIRERTKERWGYDESLKPEDTGHSDIWHPALSSGDDPEEILLYASKEDTDAYCNTTENS